MITPLKRIKNERNGSGVIVRPLRKNFRRNIMKYRKLPISITQDIPDDYRAQPVDVRILSRAEVLARAESRHEGFTATQLDAGLNVIGATLKDIVKEEMGFNLDIFGASIYIKGSGTLDGNQSFKAVLDLRAGSALQFTASGIHLEEVESVLKGPVIIAVRDAATESVNHLLTPGQIVALKGNYIKIAGADTNAGVWFRNTAGGAVTKVQSAFGDNSKSRLSFVLPALPAATYRVSVKTQYTASGRVGTELLSYELPVDLVVQAAALSAGAPGKEGA